MVQTAAHSDLDQDGLNVEVAALPMGWMWSEQEGTEDVDVQVWG